VMWTCSSAKTALQVGVFLVAAVGGAAVFLDDGTRCMAPFTVRFAVCAILAGALIQNLLVATDRLDSTVALFSKQRQR
jgi:hypothetical protein